MYAYDPETTLHLKCRQCDTVIVDRKVDDSDLNQLVVVDYGIDHREDGDWMWVECEDDNGEKSTYWKKKK